MGKKWRSLKGPVPLLFQPETLTKCKENLKDAIGKNKDKSLASFIYGISRSLKYKVKEDLYLAPEWSIKEGTIITGITVLREPKEDVEYEKPSEEDMRMFGAVLIECRTYSTPHDIYSKELKKRGRATFKDSAHSFGILYKEIIGDYTIQTLAALDWFVLLNESKDIIKYRQLSLTGTQQTTMLVRIMPLSTSARLFRPPTAVRGTGQIQFMNLLRMRCGRSGIGPPHICVLG